MSDEIIELNGIRGGGMYTPATYAAPAYVRSIRAPRVGEFKLPEWLTAEPQYKSDAIRVLEILNRSKALMARVYALGTRTRKDGSSVNLTNEVLKAMEEQNIQRWMQGSEAALTKGDITSATMRNALELEKRLPAFEGIVSGIEAGGEPGVVIQTVIKEIESKDTLKTVGYIALGGIGVVAATIIIVHLAS